MITFTDECAPFEIKGLEITVPEERLHGRLKVD